jgi:hypothetical protein
MMVRIDSPRVDGKEQDVSLSLMADVMWGDRGEAVLQKANDTHTPTKIK